MHAVAPHVNVFGETVIITAYSFAGDGVRMNSETGVKSTRREQQKERTRVAIFEAAKTLFATRGYEGTSMRAVAEEANVAVGTIFVHFSDKLDLLTHVLYQDIEATLTEAFATLPSGVPALDRLHHLVLSLYGYYAGNLDLARTLLKHSMFEPGEQAKIYDAQVAHFIVQIKTMLEDDISCGRLSPDTNVQMTAETIMAIYFYVLIDGIRQAQMKVEELGNKFRQMVEHHLRA